MATEPFLINPPRRLPMRLRHWSTVIRPRKRSIRVGKFLRRYNPIGETLVTIGANPVRRRYSSMAMYDDNPRKWTKAEREAQRKLIMRIKPWLKRGKRKAVGAEAVSVLPRKRRWKKTTIAIPVGIRVGNPRRRRRHYDNAWYGQPRRHSKAAKKGWSKRRGVLSNPRRRRYHRRYDNPRRYHRRYDNPAVTVGGIFRDITDIGNWLPVAISGGIGITTTAILPGMIAPNVIAQPTYGEFVKYGIQLVSAFGGGALVGNFVGRRHGEAWMVTSIAYVGYQLLRDWVFKPFLPQFAVGLGAYEEYYSPHEPYQTVGAGTGYGVHAFPEAQMSAFPEAQMSAYPYDGHYGY